MPQNNDFYSKIPAFTDFNEAMKPKNFVKVPNDWLLVITDVVMSTVAIENGKYKDVNAAGAAVIAAVLNVDKTLDLPFVFGGDGATLLIPSSIKENVIQALQGVQNLAKSLDLDLRASIVSANEIYAQDGKLLIAKHQIGPKYAQVVLSGDGFDLAEKMIKNVSTRHLYEVPNNPNSKADVEGFTCRWRPILSRFGETISLIIKVLDNENDLYDKISQKIEQIYGNTSQHHPLNSEALKLSLNPKDLQIEAKITNNIGFASFKKVLQLLLESLYGKIFSLAGKDKPLSNKKDSILQNTDYRKFDGSLKMIMAGNANQRETLTQFLENLYQQKKLVYGIHIANSALLTCLVFGGSGKEVHFVDGSDGGYALAAKGLKKQLREILK